MQRIVLVQVLQLIAQGIHTFDISTRYPVLHTLQIADVVQVKQFVEQVVQIGLFGSVWSKKYPELHLVHLDNYAVWQFMLWRETHDIAEFNFLRIVWSGLVHTEHNIILVQILHPV